jgi:hypothetical protein
MTRMGESTRKEDLDNLRCSYGALLFGVPHQGMNTSNLMTMVDGLGPELSLRSLEEKVDSLQRHRSNNNFNKAFNSSDSRMEYFYETRESRTMRLVSSLAIISRSNSDRSRTKTRGGGCAATNTYSSSDQNQPPMVPMVTAAIR